MESRCTRTLNRKFPRAQGFEFGKNWQHFLAVLNDERISQAESSLTNMLGLSTLKGHSLLDIGSGSGLFSLAAMRLKAEQVHSFDCDPQCVSCTQELKRRYFPDAINWSIEKGSILDVGYLQSMGQRDIVYSWGVLHHTGNMWQALENVVPLVKRGGKLFIAIYNDQGWLSKYWKCIKKNYNKNIALRLSIIALHTPYLFGIRALVRAFSRRLKLDRGMSLWYDMIDWLGGYPFEVAKPEEICEFYQKRGFELQRMKTCGSRHGCNEFVFYKP